MYFLFLLLSLSSTSFAVSNCLNPLSVVQSVLDDPLPGENLGACVGSGNTETDASIALKMKQILDSKGIFILYDEISSDPNFVSPQGESKALVSEKIPELVIVKEGNDWKLSAATRELIPKIHKETFSPVVLGILNSFPQSTTLSFLGIYLWQYIFFILLITFGWFFARIADFLLVKQLIRIAHNRSIKINEDLLLRSRRPILGIVLGGILLISAPDLMLSIRPSLVIHVTANALLSISLIFLLSALIDSIASILTAKAILTDSKLDDQIIPLLTRAAKTLLWVLGIIFVLQNIGVEVTALVAFGSVGGVAIALASKDTVENLFGSIVVFVDQPFQIGDWVIIDGSIEGVVEEVGFRSTRIRSFADSLISVPNTKIALSTVNNFGERKYRRFTTTIGLRYDTSRSKVQTYIERIRAHLQENPKIRKEAIYIYFKALGSHSLDIMVYTFFTVPDWREELAAKEELLLEFMRIAEDLEIGFAFPTTTIEVEQGSKSVSSFNIPTNSELPQKD